jgi:hypothetical protein
VNHLTHFLPWIIAGQLVLVLVISNFFVFLYSRRLKKRNQSLIIKMRQQLSLQKKMAETATTETPTVDETPAAVIDKNPFIEVVGGELNVLLNQALNQTEERIKDLGLDTTDLDPYLTAEQMVATLRYHFLESEKQALAFFNDSALMWETLQPNLDRLYRCLKISADAAHIPTLTPETQSPPLDVSTADNPDILSPAALEDAFSAMGVAEGSSAEQADTPQAHIKRHVKGLTQLIKQQRDSIEQLDKIRIIHGEPHQQEFIQEYQQQIQQMERLLDESESCIKTLESEIEQAQNKITKLESTASK